MRISALALDGNQRRPDLEVDSVEPGLNVFFGPPGSGKSALAGLVSHALYGRSPLDGWYSEPGHVPEGQVVIQGVSSRYRLRRYQDGTPVGRLTIASLDGSRVDSGAVREMLHGLPPSLAARLYTMSFREPPHLESMLSDGFVRSLLSIEHGPADQRAANMVELLARREALAHDLESRISDGRRASRELRDRWGELDRLIDKRRQELSKMQDQLRAVDTALAETDARLRYRRLETTIDQRWSAEWVDCEPQLAELDEQIGRWRSTLSDVDRRQSDLRGQIDQIAPGDAPTALADGRAWLSVARQLATDLEGEVARLARASTSQQCVCGDAHPRLRPIVETLGRQLNVLDALLDRQQQAVRVAELQQEAEHLARAQAEMRRQLEHLLDRRERLVRGARPGPRPTDGQVDSEESPSFTAADAQQLELRRSELEHQRYDLCGRIADLQPELAALCRERDAIDRQRATLLSAPVIDQVQQELAAVERQLEVAAAAAADYPATIGIAAGLERVSDFLAQLTGGELIRAELSFGGSAAQVVDRSGVKIPHAMLSPARKDQLYLSLCLALVSACEGRGVRLPLVLDEPFLRLDHHDTAALAAVLDDFARCGCQVLIFTSQRTAAERFDSLGVCVHDLRSLGAGRSAA